MEGKTLQKVIETTSDIIAGIASVGVGTVVAGPVGTFGGAAIAPVLSTGIQEFAARWLSIGESEKIGYTYENAAKKIKQYLDEGKAPRNDDFFISLIGKKAKAQIILEGTLLKSKNEYEDKKLIYYSNFLANIGFNETISYEKANVLLRLIEQLSYRQLAILAYLSDGKIIDMSRWDVTFKSEPALEEYFDFYSEMTNLYNIRLLHQAGEGIKLGSGPSKISPLGNSLSLLMELNSIPEEEKDTIGTNINSIQRIIH